jgi:methyl-accepting chemotaxis protein
MKLKLLLKIFFSSCVILFLAGGLGYISVSGLKRNARSIVEDTLPGLSYAGAANAYLADASRTLMVIITDDSKRQIELRDEINALSQRTTGYLAEYSKAVYSDEDRTNFQALVSQRQDYIKVRNQIIELAMTGKKSEALALYEEKLVPAHKSVKQAADKIFDYNMREGQERGRRIMHLCIVTQIGVALLSVVIFLIGFFLGLFK